MTRLPNQIDTFMGELAARVKANPNDERLLAVVREALAKLDGIAAQDKLAKDAQ
jgi:hypothetical protein